MSREARIITDYDPKPIPDRRWDWVAAREDDDDGNWVGYGRTEAEAIADLLELESNA